MSVQKEATGDDLHSWHQLLRRLPTQFIRLLLQSSATRSSSTDTVKSLPFLHFTLDKCSRRCCPKCSSKTGLRARIWPLLNVSCVVDVSCVRDLLSIWIEAQLEMKLSPKLNSLPRRVHRTAKLRRLRGDYSPRTSIRYFLGSVFQLAQMRDTRQFWKRVNLFRATSVYPVAGMRR